MSLFVGTIEPRKNVTGLLQAFHHLRTHYDLPEVGLAIAGGQGWLYDETMETVKSLGLEGVTHFLGRVPDEDLQQLYVGARCHIHPAFYEGFGLPPLEAMACGTPTIVSNVSSLPEVVGDAALLVNPRDSEEIAVALHRLLTRRCAACRAARKGHAARPHLQLGTSCPAHPGGLPPRGGRAARACRPPHPARQRDQILG